MIFILEFIVFMQKIYFMVIFKKVNLDRVFINDRNEFKFYFYQKEIL